METWEDVVELIRLQNERIDVQKNIIETDNKLIRQLKKVVKLQEQIIVNLNLFINKGVQNEEMAQDTIH